MARGNSFGGTLHLDPDPLDVNLDVVQQIQRWYSLCEALDKRKVSDPYDRLPVLSGIAKEFCRNFPGIRDYVAGRWTTNLTRQLLWRINFDVQWKCRLNEFIGPTWSSASIQSPFMLPAFASMPADIRLEILDHRIQYPVGATQLQTFDASKLQRLQIIYQDPWIIQQFKEREPHTSASQLATQVNRSVKIQLALVFLLHSE